MGKPPQSRRRHGAQGFKWLCLQKDTGLNASKHAENTLRKLHTQFFSVLLKSVKERSVTVSLPSPRRESTPQTDICLYTGEGKWGLIESLGLLIWSFSHKADLLAHGDHHDKAKSLPSTSSFPLRHSVFELIIML